MISKTVIISDEASEIIGKYFENYRVYQYRTDMPERALHYSKIRYFLTHIDDFLDKIYIIDNEIYIDIENICTVKFSISSNENEILIDNIYFNY
ncbi:MAG: hypothetical protein LBN95_04030 [Prevotellaceae bacterium]|jgi:hypothetical protein|nr:hypothetical protein [Prevotellaceae bacterium]